jgi:hypothetical protein
MPWADEHSLAIRLSNLPLVLCGPILRRTGANSVTVWVALKASRYAQFPTRALV